MSEHDPDLQQVTKSVAALNKVWEERKAADAEMAEEVKKFGQELPETKAKIDKMEADMERFQKIADEAVLAAKRRANVATDADGNEVDLDAKALKWAKSIRLDRHVDNFDAEGMAQYKAAFNSFLRNDERKLSGDEIKALSVGSDPDGGYTVHPDMSGRVVTKVFETSPMRAYASIQSISTDALENLYDDNEATVGWVGETASRPSTDTPEIGKWRIPVHELYANPAATQKILDDSEIDMEAWLAMKVADKFAREESAQFVAGDGINKPRGFLDYPDGTDLRTSIERFNTGVNGDYAAAPNGGDVLINALYGLKAQYRANATWFMNRATTKLTRKLKDSDGAYLWSPGIAAGQPATLLGYPVAAFEDMPDPATGSLSVAVGDMRTAYQIVDRIGIRVLRDPYTNKPYVHFYTTKRVGGDVINGEALKLVEFSA
jgi:HK97 family phage major capsid protein